jgi:hypothetical protein
MDPTTSVICCLFGLWWFQRAIICSSTSRFGEAWSKMVVRQLRFLFVDTTTFAVIMTKNGRDQQQTLPACFLYTQG